MASLVQTATGVLFAGSVDSDDDVAAAAQYAARCACWRPDDEDEDPLGGARTCFGCRARRWASDGFTCLRGLLPVQA